MARLINSKYARCTLVNLDTKKQVQALFNPKEITIEKTVPWQKHPKAKGDAPTLEFTAAEPETLSVELLFDTYESKEDVYTKHIEALRAMTLVDSKAEGEDRRPPKVMLCWGKQKFLKFKGVITSLTVKYSMFLPNGRPVRATATLKMKQAGKVQAKVKPQKTETAPAGHEGGGAADQLE